MAYSPIDDGELKGFLRDDSSFVMDTREPDTFSSGFFRGSIFCRPSALFTNILSELIPEGARLVVVMDADAKPARVLNELEGCGISTVEGYYKLANPPGNLGGSDMDMVITIEADELAMDMPHDENLVLIDVRTEAEYAEGHIGGAQHMPIEQFADPAHVALIPESANVYFYCSNGMRSMMAASIFKLHGMHNVRVILQDWDSISQTEGLKVEKDKAKLN